MLEFPGVRVSPYGLADWIEAEVLFGESGSISNTTLIGELAADAGLEAVDDYDNDYDADADDADQIIETEEDLLQIATLVDDALSEIGFRAQVAGTSYPLDLDGTVIRRTVPVWQSAPAYAFLCALNARFVHGLAADVNKGARLFERLVVPAMARYWGGESMHFGSPRDDQDAKQFGDALDKLVRAMGERLTWDKKVLPRHTGDMTVDTVAWRSLDKRRGQTVLLCQCATGQEWEAKGLELEVWEKLVSFAVRPYRALAFPFVAEALNDLDEFGWEILCGRVGVPFDRLRIAQLLAEAELEGAFRDQLIDWTSPLAALLS